jgi:hypothetical protein
MYLAVQNQIKLFKQKICLHSWTIKTSVILFRLFNYFYSIEEFITVILVLLLSLEHRLEVISYIWSQRLLCLFALVF